MRKICKYFIPWNSVYLRTIHCFCFCFFKLQWLKITSCKHSVLGYLLLPAITPQVTPQGPSALKRNLNFTVLQTCLFPLQSSIFLPPPPPTHHEGSRSACSSTGTSPAGPIKAAGAFDEVDRDQWDRGRGLNWRCYRRGGQVLETAGNGDQWLLGVITTFICIEESIQHQIHPWLAYQVFLGLQFLCFKDLDYENKEQHFVFMFQLVLFHFG